MVRLAVGQHPPTESPVRSVGTVDVVVGSVVVVDGVVGGTEVGDAALVSGDAGTDAVVEGLGAAVVGAVVELVDTGPTELVDPWVKAATVRSVLVTTPRATPVNSPATAHTMGTADQLPIRGAACFRSVAVDSRPASRPWLAELGATYSSSARSGHRWPVAVSPGGTDHGS